MAEYRGYHIEETPDGYKIYTNRDAWINGEEPVRCAISIEVAQNWIDRDKEIEASGKFERVPVGEDLVDYIKTLPFMPEQGQPIPETVMKGLYPSPIWDLMEPPVSEYGRAIVEETAKRLKDFMIGGNFTIKEKFSEAGWSSEDIAYIGDLFHSPTLTVYMAQMNTFFEWRETDKIITVVISLWKKNRSEEDDAVWDGELTLEEGKIANKMLLELAGKT
jgi:hypothetical protein